MNQPDYQHFISPRQTDISVFASICQQQTRLADYPFASETRKNVLIYDGPTLARQIKIQRQAIMNEMHHALSHGPGVLVIRHAYADLGVVDRQSAVFEEIFAAEAMTGVAADHFAKAGANGRIWNSLQKVAERNPAAFIEYYANPLMDLVNEAWLGPAYQMTAQVNVVRPGGQAQQPHRDYHLGFQVEDEVARYPLALQHMSQYMTLQGAVAHTDMPLETGPTLLLPYSQQYEAGYLAWRQSAFIDYFTQHAIQLPLEKGDMLFFSPALFHAAGTNHTQDQHRMANLLQSSCAFGKPMETINRPLIMRKIYPVLKQQLSEQKISMETAELAILMSADGYAFPTNLDTDPPLGGLAPQTGQDLLRKALAEHWPVEQFDAEVARIVSKRLA
ncbi:phytanoyl-CoA dioxygenase family protein [Leeia oryzae]|uniref:phytanoyl-CoA dioxygenase family protein n=1 Tax=Leeia oryzae TaxID=356662 RepID=UPI00036E06AD|nr:phytanoyl-CoA dioxygenase family protein [Leeia oryzae]